MKVSKKDLETAVKEISKELKVLKDGIKSGKINENNITLMKIQTNHTDKSVTVEFDVRFR